MCEVKAEFTYDADGNVIAYRDCESVDETTGKCVAYGYGYDYMYDENGRQIAGRECGDMEPITGKCMAYVNRSYWDSEYDIDGNKTAQRVCTSIDTTTGQCLGYGNSNNYDWVYDDNGNRINRILDVDEETLVEMFTVEPDYVSIVYQYSEGLSCVMISAVIICYVVVLTKPRRIMLDGD